MKKYALLSTTLIIFLLFFQSCENEEIQENTATEEILSSELEATISSITYKFANPEEITDVLGAYSTELSKIGITGKDVSSNIGTNSIMEISTINDTKTYSAIYDYENASDNYFYNIVVKKNSDGSLQQPFMVKYERDASAEDVNNKNWEITTFWLDNTLGSKKELKATTPCPTIILEEDQPNVILTNTEGVRVRVTEEDTDGESIPFNIDDFVHDNPSGGNETPINGFGGLGGSTTPTNTSSTPSLRGGNGSVCVTTSYTVSYKCNGPNSDTPHKIGDPDSNSGGGCGDASTNYGGSGTRTVLIETCISLALARTINGDDVKVEFLPKDSGDVLVNKDLCEIRLIHDELALNESVLNSIGKTILQEAKKILRGLDVQCTIGRDDDVTFTSPNLTGKLASSDDCPSINGIGVNIPTVAIMLVEKLNFLSANATPLTEREKNWVLDIANLDKVKQINAYLEDNNNSVEAKEFAIEVIKTFSSTKLSEYTTKAKLISQINIATNLIIKFGLPADKELGLFFKKINTSLSKSNFSELTNDELYNYYTAIYESHGRMQLNRLGYILVSVAESFKPVIKVALITMGGSATLTVLKALPTRLITVEISAIINRLITVHAPIVTTTTSAAYKSLMHASKYGIHTFSQLETQLSTLGISRSANNMQIHHLIEQRFLSVPGVAQWLGASTANWKGIVVSSVPGIGNEHNNLFSQPWIQAIAKENMNAPGWTNTFTSDATLQDVKNAATVIYADYPEILEALGLN